MSALESYEPDRQEPDMETRFRAGMRRLASGISIIASGTMAEPAGLVATSVTSLTLEPPTLLVCVALSASAYGTISRTGALSVNILGAADASVADPFTDPAVRSERFERGTWRKLATGVPVLASALGAFDCEIAEKITYSTHAIFIARACAVTVADQPGHPLVHFNRGVHLLEAL